MQHKLNRLQLHASVVGLNHQKSKPMRTNIPQGVLSTKRTKPTRNCDKSTRGDSDLMNSATSNFCYLPVATDIQRNWMWLGYTLRNETAKIFFVSVIGGLQSSLPAC